MCLIQPRAKENSLTILNPVDEVVKYFEIPSRRFGKSEVLRRNRQEFVENQTTNRKIDK